MEKEQKKLLLVAVSVGVFLLVTITVAIIILTPGTQIQGTPFSSSSNIQQGGIQPEGSTGSSSVVTAPFQPVINGSQETNNNIGTNTDTPSAIDSKNGDSLTIQIPRPGTAVTPDTPETTASTARTSATSVTTAPVTTTSAASASRTTPVTQQTAAAQPRPAQTTQSRTTTPARTINDYWIQTGAFAAKVRAEDARELLASKGLTSIIENREIDGRIWYRVRLGPYTSENEANYWLALVKTIDGFGESQVRQTTRQQ